MLFDNLGNVVNGNFAVEASFGIYYHNGTQSAKSEAAGSYYLNLVFKTLKLYVLVKRFYECRAVILAPGITREKLYPGEAEYLGRGVSYCATCDGMLYRGKTVALIGGSEEARHDAEFLRGIGCNVIELPGAARYEIIGTQRAEAVVSGGETYPVDGVFIIKDTVSVANLMPGLERSGAAISVGRGMETSIPGVFAAGDCTGKPYQAAKAVGEGNIAALSACEYIDKL